MTQLRVDNLLLHSLHLPTELVSWTVQAVAQNHCNFRRTRPVQSMKTGLLSTPIRKQTNGRMIFRVPTRLECQTA